MLHDDRNREEARLLEENTFDRFETADTEDIEKGLPDGCLKDAGAGGPAARRRRSAKGPSHTTMNKMPAMKMNQQRLLCSLLILGILFLLAGCHKSALQKPAFPLQEADIITALEQTTLSCTLSEDKTILSEEQTSYVLDSENQKFPAAIIISSNYDGKRILSLTFISPPTSTGYAFSWEDWEQQFAFAASLYGGFSDRDEIYQGFFAQDVSDGKLEISENDLENLVAEQYEWDKEFPAGYCRIHYKLVNSSIETYPIETEISNIVEQTPHMTISIYESLDCYNEHLQQQSVQDKQQT